MGLTKNEQIKKTLFETRSRRADMLCCVYEIKVVSGKLSRMKKDHLDSLFREAKWLRNSELAKDDLSRLDRNAKIAEVKVGDKTEVRELTHLGSQMKQDIVDQLKSDVRGLSVLKSHGYKVGKLKFKSVCNSVPLRQFGCTYRIDFDKNTITIQGLKKPLKVRGLNQLSKKVEIANAKLIRKPSGYYFHITTYVKPKKSKQTGNECGIDFGIETNMTLSDGSKFDIFVSETKAVKLASKRMNKAFKRNEECKSKNHYKRLKTLQRAYEHQTNIKHDMANKVVHNILSNHDFVAIQDEMIVNWHHGWFGKQVQHSAMGIIKAKLKNSSKVYVVERSFPSTQICPVCNLNTKHDLNERTYKCSHCGYEYLDRDVKSAMMILSEAHNSLEQRTKGLVEFESSD